MYILLWLAFVHSIFCFCGSAMLMHMAVVHSSSVLLYRGASFFCPIANRPKGLFSLFFSLPNTTVVFLCKWPGTHVLEFPLGIYREMKFIVTVECQIIFQNGCTHSYTHLQCMKICFPHDCQQRVLSDFYILAPCPFVFCLFAPKYSAKTIPGLPPSHSPALPAFTWSFTGFRALCREPKIHLTKVNPFWWDPLTLCILRPNIAVSFKWENIAIFTKIQAAGKN